MPTCAFYFVLRYLSFQAWMSFQYISWKCGKPCKNAGGRATHVKTHKKKSVASPSLLKFLKRNPAKKIPIELKPIRSKPKQVRFQSSTLSTISSPDVPSNNILPPKKRPIPQHHHFLAVIRNYLSWLLQV